MDIEETTDHRGQGLGFCRDTGRGTMRGRGRGTAGDRHRGRAVDDSPPFDRSKKLCGYEHGDNNCPANGQRCRRCGGRNHFGRVCKSL